MTPHKESQERKDWRASQERMVGKLVAYQLPPEYFPAFRVSEVITDRSMYYPSWQHAKDDDKLPSKLFDSPFFLVGVVYVPHTHDETFKYHTMIHGLHPDHGPFLCLLFPTNCMEEVKGEE